MAKKKCGIDSPELPRYFPVGNRLCVDDDKMKEYFLTKYHYPSKSEEERLAALEELGANPEITRFKGLGEISPDEFKHFIGPDMRLDQVKLRKEDAVAELLSFYMGDNTPERQNFIVENLVIEDDEI